MQTILMEKWEEAPSSACREWASFLKEVTAS
jgi:hypothetical protein